MSREIVGDFEYLKYHWMAEKHLPLNEKLIMPCFHTLYKNTLCNGPKITFPDEKGYNIQPVTFQIGPI